LNIILVFEWIAFAFSLFLFHPRNASVRMVVAIMAITVLVEAIGYYYHRVLGKANHQFYNVSVPLIILLFLALLRQHIEKRRYRNVINTGILLFILFALFNAAFLQGMRRFCSYTYIAGALLLVLSVMLYYVELIKRPVHISLKKEPMFWIGTSILVLYLPKSILYAAFEYLAYHHQMMNSFGATFHLMNKGLSIIFFCGLSYASICRLIFRS
jgi:hypothetical protein